VGGLRRAAVHPSLIELRALAALDRVSRLPGVSSLFQGHAAPTPPHQGHPRPARRQDAILASIAVARAGAALGHRGSPRRANSASGWRCGRSDGEDGLVGVAYGPEFRAPDRDRV
jgi:hypothetical protein